MLRSLRVLCAALRRACGGDRGFAAGALRFGCACEDAGKGHPPRRRAGGGASPAPRAPPTAACACGGAGRAVRLRGPALLERRGRVLGRGDGDQRRQGAHPRVVRGPGGAGVLQFAGGQRSLLSWPGGMERGGGLIRQSKLSPKTSSPANKARPSSSSRPRPAAAAATRKTHHVLCAACAAGRFFLPDFLACPPGLNLGRTQSRGAVGDVALPPWAGGSPAEFVRIHRQVQPAGSDGLGRGLATERVRDMHVRATGKCRRTRCSFPCVHASSAPGSVSIRGEGRSGARPRAGAGAGGRARLGAPAPLDRPRLRLEAGAVDSASQGRVGPASTR